MPDQALIRHSMSAVCPASGYGVFMIPSTYMTMRYGARVWYSTITILWGVIAGCGALINSPTTLYVLRFFLGAAEVSCVAEDEPLLNTAMLATPDLECFNN